MPCRFISATGSTLPADWECKGYKPTPWQKRAFIVALSAAIPIVFVIVASGVLKNLNVIMRTSGYTFYGVTLAIFLIWLLIIVKGSAHPDRTITEYIEAGLGTLSYLIVGAGGVVSLITKLL